MTAIILRSSSAMTDLSRQRLERDPVLGLEEWLWCFDFTNPACNPTTATTPANGTEFVNLARDFDLPETLAPVGTLRNAGGTITQSASREGLIFPSGTKDVTDFFEIGGSYMDFSTDNDDYLAIVWDEQPLSGFNTANYQPILWDTSNNANTASLWIDSGLGGEAVRGVLGTGATSLAAIAPDRLGQGEPRQIAFARIGTTGYLYVNGKLVGTNA
ncbi:hypothetical protein, partial [Roseivivax isoporae]|uniref:hypothetical protein n=1 Tax=Roseivivax isoporae TaxID=591206 RepID=UPI0005C15D36